jgi:MFS family permease
MKRLKGFSDETFRSLRFRNFRLFFIGQGISQVGNWLTLITQTLLVLHLTNSGVAVGLLTACQFAPVLVFGAFAGLVADRSDKRRLLVIVQFCAMAQSFALAGLALMGDPPVLAIYAVAFAGGLSLAFDNPARRAFVVEMVPEESVNNAVALNSAVMTSSRVIGPALAGLLIATLGYAWAFALDGLSYVAVIIGLCLMDPAEIRRSPIAERGKRQVRAGLSYVRGVPDLWVPLVMMAVVGTLTFNFQVVMPLLVKRTFDGDDALFTILFSVISVGSLIGALSTARRKVVGVRHIIVSSAAFGVTMLALALTPTLALTFPIGIAVGWASISFLTASTALVQVQSAPEMRGRVLALQAIVFLGSTPIGGPIVGAVSQAFGPRAGIALGGFAALAAAAFGIVVRRRARDRAGAQGVSDATEPGALQVA